MVLKVIKKRRSVRKYKSRLVEKDKVNEILKAAMFSPSARNTRAWEFIVVTEKSLKDKLAATKPHSSFANQAPVILVLCSYDWQYWAEDLSEVKKNLVKSCQAYFPLFTKVIMFCFL